MSIYDHKQLLSDYTNGSITVETALGYNLQHVDRLYELQTVATMNRYELRGKVDQLENRINTLQIKVDSLTTLLEKLLPKLEQA